MRLWTRAEQWEARGAFKAWLFRIATNLALNHLRSVHRQPGGRPWNPGAGRRDRREESPRSPHG